MNNKDDHKLIKIFAVLFTTSGSILRAINDLIPCPKSMIGVLKNHSVLILRCFSS